LYQRSGQLPHCSQSPTNVSPHPEQAADEFAEADGVGRLSFRVILSFCFPDFFLCCFQPFQPLLYLSFNFTWFLFFLILISFV
jgi:hypothetical protein